MHKIDKIVDKFYMHKKSIFKVIAICLFQCASAGFAVSQEYTAINVQEGTILPFGVDKASAQLEN